MAWNEPDDNERDPWGRRRNEQGPPDLDEVVRKLQDRLRRLFGGRKGGGGEGRVPAGGEGGFAIGFLVIAAILLWAVVDSFYRIEPAERGVVRRFGTFVATLQPGPHFRFPRPIEYVDKVNVDAFRQFAVEATMLTGDENIVNVHVVTQYRINNAADYLFTIADPDDTVRQLTESSIREIIGTSKIDFVMTEGRGEIALRARDLLQQILEGYSAGIEVTSVNLQEVAPPEAVKAAFDDAIMAREDEQRKINEAQAYQNEVIERSQGEADRMLRQAEAYRERVVANATGESRRFDQLLTEYSKAPEVTRRRLYLETMEAVLSATSKVIMDSDNSNNLMYLPLNEVMRNAMPRGRVQIGSDTVGGGPLNPSSQSSAGGGNRGYDPRARETR